MDAYMQLGRRSCTGRACGVFTPPCHRQPSGRLRQTGAGAAKEQAQVPSSSYSAADDPEMRKNAAVYQDLQAASTHAAAGPASLPVHPLAGGDEEASATVSYMLPAASPRLTKPEVLAPAGGWPQLKAACENGADAVYFGLADFSARARASNFSLEELPEVMSYLHKRGLKGFVALNVLVFDEELSDVEDRARSMAAAGVDAVIVQDLGVIELLRRAAPNLPVHGSTQITITSPEGADFVAGLGVERVVVGRELSVREIAKVRAGTNVEVETFVHGALCVSYSGQCFSSEAWGGRSANRGQCAQACRMPYGLIVDGEIKEMGDIKYLLSPQDLMAVDQVPELIAAGVSCFKIEGRLKGPEYVSLTTRVYREAVDAAWSSMSRVMEEQQQGAEAGQQGQGSSAEAVAAGKLAVQLTDRQRWDLEQVFSRGQDEEHRGLTPGFLEGSAHQRLVRGRAPRHRGVLLGAVEEVGVRSVGLTLLAPLRRGDGVVFDAGSPEEEEVGGSVYEVESSDPRGPAGAAGPGETVLLKMGPEQRLRGRVQVGDLVWKTHDPELEQRVRRTFEGLAAADLRRVPVDVQVQGAVGQPLLLTLRDDEGRVARVSSGVVLQAAGTRPMTLADVQKYIGPQLGSEVLQARSLDTSGLELAAGLFLPVSEFKALRRSAADLLIQQRCSHSRDTALAPDPVLPALLAAVSAPPPSSTSQQQQGAEPEELPPPASASASASAPQQAVQGLRLLCRTRAQVEAACAVPWLREVVLDFLEVMGLKEAVAAVRAAGKRVVVATPRVLKPDEERLVHFYLRLGADALLIRSLGLLNQMVVMGGAGAPVPQLGGVLVPALEGDFSLNAANALSADLLIRRGGLTRLAPTHDLNAPQLGRLARGLGPRAALLEAVVHQHLPIFHTEHCVFCRFLSTGNSYKDCGHPCEKSSIHLRDEQGKDHLVLADMGCRNTVFNARAQSGLWSLPELIKSGYQHLRIELVDEPAQFVGPLLEAYRDAILGSRPPSELWSWLGTLPDANGRVHGVGAGSLQVTAERGRSQLKLTASQQRQQQQQQGAR